MIHLAYACQMLRIPPGSVREHLVAIFPEPGRPRMFGFIGYENDTSMFGVAAMAGLQPPGEHADMVNFAADFAPPHVLDAIRAAEPLGEVAHFRIPSNRWRRYDKMRRVPDGLLVFGDAICSFNPIYGQGMTVAALESTALRDCLRAGDHALPAQFVQASAKIVRVAWQTAVGSDLALPEVEGARPPSVRVTNAYLQRVLTAAEDDLVVAQRFIRVIGMVDSPASLMHPAIVTRVAATPLRRRRASTRTQRKPSETVS